MNEYKGKCKTNQKSTRIRFYLPNRPIHNWKPVIHYKQNRIKNEHDFTIYENLDQNKCEKRDVVWEKTLNRRLGGVSVISRILSLGY